MAKRIISIKISNCRAYCDNYDAISLPEGDNVLIYGENGSGKSSLYKAIKNYFQKSIDSTTPFVTNRYLNDQGEILLTFADFNYSPLEIIPNTEEKYKFGTEDSDNDVQFIQTASRINGFLDYTDLLKVYLHKEARPNLFELIVLSLLGNHIPIASGGNIKFKNQWDKLQKNLIENAYTRNDRCHVNAINELPQFEIHLRSTLDLVFEELNRLLRTYFSELAIELNYILLPLQFNYGAKLNWYTTSDLRLDVIKDGVSITGDYSDFLNEARLSAIAICLYLASLLKNPSNVDLKILFLDDIFIGLDAGNRIPILNILRDEFSGYQKFISTYDRHWFELAKRQFEVNGDNSWSTLEIYAGSEEIGDILISKPIIVFGSTHFEKAVQYLHNNFKPDYPASSNYFRKAIEEIIQNLIPPYELVDAENTLIADYKLTLLLSKSKRFLEKIGVSTSEITKIIGLLHNLIHPFSHHEITSPIYKAELLILENVIPKLQKKLLDLNIKNNYRCLLEKGKIIRIQFPISNINHFYQYQLKLKEAIILIGNNGTDELSVCQCYTEKIEEIENGNQKRVHNPSRNSAISYNSLESAHDLIYEYLTTQTQDLIPKEDDYLSQIEFHDGSNWVNLSDKINR